jgi:hypothetical protein
MKTFLAICVVCAAAAATAAPLDEAKAAHAAGMAAYQRGDFQTALAEFERANQLAPAPEIDLNIGACYEQLGRYHDAVLAFERYIAAVEGRPDIDEQGRHLVWARERAAADRQRADAAPVAASPVAAPAAGSPEPPAAGAPSVTAAAPARSEKEAYPLSLVERPLILPRFMFQPSVAFDITNVDQAGNGTVFGFALDVGLSRRLQAGVFFAFPIDPNADFGNFVANLQVGVADPLNLRLDLGAERLAFAAPSIAVGTKDAFIFGLGVPIKLKLHRMLAFVSGSSTALGFGWQTNFADKMGRSSIYGFVGGITSNDVLSLLVYDSGGGGGKVTIGALTLPVGFLFTPIERLTIGVRSGYRLVFNHVENASGTPLAHYIPLAFDLVVAIVRQLDVGFTATLQGNIDNDRSSVGLSVGYADFRQFTVWVSSRL